ncbi:hypothetical protein AVEN_160938-1 [Araneus ventricosus]|uniref:Uncharacterized protein n=1 Tax=Araneus ventricosus TaxID=182803 RepID=A0A4Y2JQD3_ARAVE|nr:hypothetical protein AVEN_160938-1 [Araneus ventricosus]
MKYFCCLRSNDGKIIVINNPSGGNRPYKVYSYTNPSQRKDEIQGTGRWNSKSCQAHVKWRPRWPSGRSRLWGRRVRNPIPPKIRRVWDLPHAKSCVVAKRSHVGVA